MTSPEPPARAGSANLFPVRQLLLVAVVGLSSVTQGATNGWSAMLPKMQDDPRHLLITEDDVTWLVSLLPIVGMFASLVTGPLVECVGPRRLTTLALFLCVGLWLFLAFPPNKPLLYVGRAGLGTCVYVISTIALPLLAELSPARVRGLSSSFSEISGALGVMIAYLLAFLAPWDIATALCALTAALVMVPMLFVPESPYWLVRRGRTEAARASLQRLIGAKSAAEEELSAISSSPTASQESRSQQFRELRRSRNLVPTVLVLSLFALRELGGRSCVMLYSVYIFRAAGVQLDAFSCTVLLGAVRLLSTCVTAFILDHAGRRPLLIGTALVGALSQGVCGLFLRLQVRGASWVPLLAILTYQAAYGVGLGPVPWVYVGELLPSPVRSLAASIISSCNAVVAFSMSLAFLKVMSSLGVGLTFIIFGGINFLIAGIAYQWIPESRKVTLQQLEHAFARHRPRDPEAGHTESLMTDHKVAV